MEPILELATRLTTQLWFLHELYPHEVTISAVLSKNWRADLERGATSDYARLQILLDLTGQANETDWDPDDPLKRFEVTGQQAESWQWNLLQVFRSKRDNRLLRLDGAEEIRAKAANTALDVLEQRVSAVHAQGLNESINFLPLGRLELRTPHRRR